jgi:hypothetical protein
LKLWDGVVFGKEKVKKKKEKPEQKKEKKFGYKEEDDDWMVRFGFGKIITSKLMQRKFGTDV